MTLLKERGKYVAGRDVGVEGETCLGGTGTWLAIRAPSARGGGGGRRRRRRRSDGDQADGESEEGDDDFAGMRGTELATRVEESRDHGEGATREATVQLASLVLTERQETGAAGA